MQYVVTCAAGIYSYLITVLRNTSTFLILDTYHTDKVYLRDQGCEDPRLFFEANRGREQKKFGKQCYKTFLILRCIHSGIIINLNGSSYKVLVILVRF
jgi:hypothetical protein